MSDPSLEIPVEGLSDGVIRLRLKADADLPAVVDACRDPEIARWTRVPDDYTAEDGRTWFAQVDRAHACGAELALLIVDADDGELLGSVGLHDIEAESRRAAIGYWVAAPARGRGVAVRAVRLLARFAFETFGFERLQIEVEPDNQASRRVPERAGFTEEGLLRAYILIKGARRDVIVYSLLAGELG